MYGKHYFNGYISGIEVGRIIENELSKKGDIRYKQFYSNIFNAVRKSKKVRLITEGHGNGKRIYYHKEEVITEIKRLISRTEKDMSVQIKGNSLRSIVNKSFYK